MDFEDWLAYGMGAGYCSRQFCMTHDGGPLTKREEEAWEKGYDPCAHYVRLGTPDDWDESLFDE